MCKDCLKYAQQRWPNLPDNASPMLIAKLILPELEEDDIGYLLWNETAYPFNCYHRRGKIPGWGRQLRRAGKSLLRWKHRDTKPAARKWRKADHKRKAKAAT